MEPEQAIQILLLLEKRQKEFRGPLWSPRRLQGVTVINALMGVVEELVEDIEGLPLSGLPGGSLTRWRHEMTLANERLVRNRMFDQATFFREIGTVFDRAGRIFEELSRLERVGYFNTGTLEPE